MEMTDRHLDAMTAAHALGRLLAAGEPGDATAEDVVHYVAQMHGRESRRFTGERPDAKLAELYTLDLLNELRKAIDAAQYHHATSARRAGASLTEIGAALGISKQAGSRSKVRDRRVSGAQLRLAR
ncbi:hypothetical protein [Pseudarthrobacter albicanus]|uniref:hypothetical protein n=1 Tax=Pseudarthrobacter albicanus TaxID=2823873 RepID=UPI001BAC79E7|nr:hypothetical protein [Pseudarthrobacter albicanus]